MDLALWVYIKLNGAPLKKSLDELKNTPKTSIVVFSNTALGDTLLSTPAIKSLKDSFPNARITLFVHKNIYPLLEGSDFIDNFVIYHGGYKKFFSTVMQLRHLKADAALLMHSNGPQDIPMAIMSGAKTILKTPTKSSYKHYLSHEIHKSKRHVIEDRLDLVRSIGADKLNIKMLLPHRYYGHKKKEILPEDILVVGFQPGAANIYKMWPVENFKELANIILVKYPNAVIAVTGSKKEHRLGEAIKEVNSKRIINFCGEFSIESLPNLISEMDILITNDTGTMHLAIALSVSTVELFGVTDSVEYGPYQDKHLHTVLQREHSEKLGALPKAKRGDEAMRRISVQEVFEVIDKVYK